jgi:ribosomal RNA-processing protein 9
MADSFFQKKRKKTGEVGGGGSHKVSARSSKAGPSRLRMKEKAGTGERVRKGDAAAESDEDNDGEGGLEEMDLRHRYDSDLQESDEDEMETPAEAKVRLAKQYLEGLRGDEVGEWRYSHAMTIYLLTDSSLLADPNDADAAEADRQNIAARLQADVSSQSSHVHNFVADRLQFDISQILACRGHMASVTCALVDASCKYLWTAGKDGQLIRWRVRDGKMMEIISKTEVEGVQRHRKQPSSLTSGAARRRAREMLMKATPHSAKETTSTNGIASNGITLNGNSTDQYCKKLLPEEGQGHSDEVWALTVSSDGKYLVSGGKDRRICVWSLESGQTRFVKALGGHKDSITALRFRTGSHDLFSASSDRTLKLFDVSQLSYVETFFGHQEEVASLDLLRGEVAVSAGARDRTVRWWKVREESQLVFRGGAKSKVRDVLEGGDLFDEEEEGEVGRKVKKSAFQEQWVEGSIDSVAMIDEHTFLSGGDSGTISLWSLSKKKPIFTAPIAHGFHTVETETEGKIQTPRWITSLACLPYGDVFASGSWDGQIRLWKINSSLRSFSPLHQVSMQGFINSLQLIMPSRSTLKKQGSIVEEETWRRKTSLANGDHTEPAEAQQTAVQENGSESPAVNGSAHPKELILLSVGVGQEPSRGRWLRLKQAKNGASIVPLYLK